MSPLFIDFLVNNDKEGDDDYGGSSAVVVFGRNTLWEYSGGTFLASFVRPNPVLTRRGWG